MLSNSAALSNTLRTYTTYTNPQDYNLRGYGFAIRCVIREGWKSIRIVSLLAFLEIWKTPLISMYDHVDI